MLMCSKCGKRPAVVFISQMNGVQQNDNGGMGKGYCIVCAKEAGIPQIDDYMKRMGLSETDIEEMADLSAEMFDDGDSFEQGGSSTLPEFLGNITNSLEKMFGGSQQSDPESDEKPEDGNNNARHMRRFGDSKKPQDGKKTPKLKYLGAYCTNLSEKAENEQLDPCIGRERELDRVVQILSRRQKNNPCLIGEPGVGKTAIAEGIAQKIASGDVPYDLRKKKVFLLDMAALVAGTQFRGQFESRMKGLIDEVKKLGNVILFIDEVHSIVGAGDSEGSMNASNILKPALSRGEVQVIGATTFKEYRKYIEKDAALERRFQPVTVKEPTVADTALMLNGLKKYYEKHHSISVSDRIVRECAILSERYITDRYLPDKAIDLLDEACAYASIRNKAIEASKRLTDEYAEEKKVLDELEGENDYPNYEKIGEQKMKCLSLEKQLDAAKEEADKAEVTEADLAHVIEVWTGIPANKIEETEYAKIRMLPGALSNRVIGQQKAVDAVCAAVRRSRVHLSKRIRPASFIFVGPTGVGKTELVKVLGETLFDENEPLIRVDMSEYMERHSVSKLIGSPPGYVGFDEAGQLTEKIRRKPYSVVLFDEIEKAHPDVMNILLQILDEGEIHDAQGRLISFKNTVIVMTSNAGSTSTDTGMGFNKTDSDISKDRAMKALREFLRPEFLGRIDEVVVFGALSKEDYAKIAGLMLGEMREALEESAIKLEWTDEALKIIAEKSHGHGLGGRDIRRVIREEIEDKLSIEIVERGEGAVAACKIDAADGKIDIAVS